MKMASAKVFQCDRFEIETGEICGQTFTRRWNLDRHVTQQHPVPFGRFINYVPSSDGGIRRLSDSENSPDTPQATAPILASPMQCITPALTASTPEPAPVQVDPFYTTAQHHTTPPWLLRKNKRCRDLCGSANKDDLPFYEVKRSRKVGGQQRGIQWLTQAAKNHFDQFFAESVARWGLTSSHKGTCVLAVGGWMGLEPLTIAGLFRAESCPNEYEEDVVCPSLPIVVPKLTLLEIFLLRSQHASHSRHWLVS